MRESTGISVYLVIGLLATGAAAVEDAATGPAPFDALPAAFEPNLGQFGDEVLFAARGAGYTFALTASEAVMAGISGEAVSRLRWLGAASATGLRIRGLRPLEATSGYFLGDDPARWRPRVPRYEAVEYAGVYPGIDLVFYFGADGLEYDFVVAPGADPEAIRLELDGGRPEIDSEGHLRLTFAAAEVVHHAPYVFQEIAGRRQAVPGSFRQRPGGEIGFEVAGWDRERPLVIDPKIRFSTFLGGREHDFGANLALDEAGRIFVLGHSASPKIGNVAPEMPFAGGSADLVIARLDKRGKLDRLVYLGGDDYEISVAIAVANGPGPGAREVVYVVGSTISLDFPTMLPIQGECAVLRSGECSVDATITVLDLDLGEILFSTYLGGTDVDLLAFADQTGDLAVDASGRIAVVGSTRSKDLPTRRPTQKKRKGKEDAAVSVLEPAVGGGYELAFSTYLGGKSKKSETMALGTAFDDRGRLHVAGWTDAKKKFPTVGAIQNKLRGPGDGFLTVYDLGGSGAAPEIVFSTYFGGRDFDLFFDVVVDEAGWSYVTGATLSSDYPTVTPFDATLGGRSDALVTVFNLDLATASGRAPEVVMSTLFGGRESEVSHSLAVDRTGVVHFAGQTFSRDLPTRSPVQRQCAQHPSATPDCWDGFVARLGPIVAGQAPELLFSTFLGGPQVGLTSGGEAGLSVAVDRNRATYVAGRTGSSRFPTRKAGQKNAAGGIEMFVTKIKK